MKKILLKLLIPIFVFFNSSYLIAGDYNLGITIDGGTTSIYRINKATGAGTLLETTTLLQSLNTDRSYVDSANGNLIIRGGAPISGDDVWLSYDIDADTITQLTTPDVENVFMFENAWDGKAAEEIITTGTDAEDSSTTTILGSLDISDSSGNTLIEQNATGTTIGIGEDASGETGLIISNTSTALDIQDGAGDTVIKVTSDGATHIGENSLITIETGGVQQLYATNSSGQQIDIDIKSGTNLLIGGRNIIDIIGGDISGSVALSSALAALPNASPDAFYTCGVGTGIHDSSSALSAGCASDFANYAFVDRDI